MKHSYLKDHERFLKEGLTSGLCSEYADSCISKPTPGSIFEMVSPTDEDFQTLKSEGRSIAYWAYEYDKYYDFELKVHPCDIEYSPLRQTIVLLMAAINGEL